MTVTELNADALYKPCSPESLGFSSTDELPDLQDIIGQPRVLRALELGSEVSSPGYNIFILGLPSSGRTTLTQEYLQRKALSNPVPDDFCYINNFEDPHNPKQLRLPPGEGSQLCKHMRDLVQFCKDEIPRAFESEEYTQERDQILSELKQQQETEFNRLQQHVQQFNFVIVRTTYGFVLMPAHKGEPLKPEELEKLPLEKKAELEKLQAQLSQEVESTIQKMHEMDRAIADKLRELNHHTAQSLLTPAFDKLKSQYNELDAVIDYLDAVKEDMIENLGRFLPEQSQGGDQATALMQAAMSSYDWWRRYEINLLVDNSGQTGAPVIVESQPSYHNLIGGIEHETIMGASRTDFTMIRPGAFHRANGGYLILPARDLLINPYAWEGLKRVLRDRSIRIIELSTQLGIASTVTLEPEPIPLNAKVILVGTPLLYYLLRANDEDFSKLFKVRAEFSTDMDREPQTEKEYGLFIHSVTEDNQLLPFEASAVARVIEYSARLAEDQDKLSARFGKIADLACEAAYWANKNKNKTVTAQSVQQAIDEMIYRSNLLDEKIQEMINNRTLMIAVEGRTVGQINALSVLSLGDYAFGKPSRVTASVAPGKSGIVDIERQAKLGGPIHTKGVLIINGFLSNRFTQKKPLSLSASLTFEQSYEEIEGDSASAAELLALLSAITNIPLCQDRAITGSINQHGKIQAIGGVNEKIEGFFTTCQARTLNGSQGVIIPESNKRHLMLKEEVRQAVSQGEFHIWPVKTIEEAIEILTDMQAGEITPDGEYPDGSFYALAMQRLREFSQVLEPENKQDKDKANEA